MDADRRERRLHLVEEHFASEVEQKFDRTLATFNGHPHYGHGALLSETRH